MENAIPPSGMPMIFKNIKKDQEDLFTKLKEEDEAFWADLPKHGTYGKIKEYILSLIDGLDELEGKAFDNGASLEEIGLRRAVNRLTKANLMSFITKVEKTVETVNTNRKNKQTGKSGR